MTRLALIGIGRWGKRLLRVLDPRCRVALCCGRSSASDRDWLRANYPSIPHTVDLEAALHDASITAVAIATPPETHAALVRRALDAGKHVFVEKPLATTVAEAQALVMGASERDLELFVGHTFLFHPVFELLERMCSTDAATSLRISWRKLGTFDSPLLWSLLPHAVALGIQLFGKPVQSTTILHESGLCTERDILCARLDLGGRELFVDLDRCAPTPSRTITVVTASGRTLVWHEEALGELLPGGELRPLAAPTEEALAREIDAFVASWQGRAARSGGRLGLEVVEGIAKIEKALRCST